MRLARLAIPAVFLTMTALVHGQAPEQQKLLAKRAAEADAYRKLAETVYGLRINSTTYVKDFVTESDQIRGAVDAFVKGVRLGQPRWYEDNSCEVSAEVTVAKVIESLSEAHRTYYKGRHVQVEDFQHITQTLQKDVIRVTGRGAPREDLPPNLPLGVAEMLGAPPSGPKAPAASVPQIWKQVGPQGKLMALEAARKDAQRKLAERIKGLRLTSDTLVRDFVTESDVITSELSAELVGTRQMAEFLRSDELIAEVTMSVPTEQVITAIQKIESRRYKGHHLVSASDIERAVQTVVKKEFEATGMGVPPERFIRRYAEVMQIQMPDWVGRPVEAQGSGTDPEMESPQGKLRAARAAEMDARRRLAERIGGLTLSAQTTVREFMMQRDEIVGRVDAIIVDADVTSTRFDGGAAVVTIALPGLRVWGVVNEQSAPPGGNAAMSQGD